jgi:hypothetical protein
MVRPLSKKGDWRERSERERQIRDDLNHALDAALDFQGSDVVAPLEVVSRQRPLPSAEFAKNAPGPYDIERDADFILSGIDHTSGLPSSQEFSHFFQYRTPSLQEMVMGIVLHTVNGNSFTDNTLVRSERANLLKAEGQRMGELLAGTDAEDRVREAVFAKSPYMRQKWSARSLGEELGGRLQDLADEGLIDFKSAPHLTGKTIGDPYPTHLHPPSKASAALRAQVFSQVMTKTDMGSGQKLFDISVVDLLQECGFESEDWDGIVKLVREQTKAEFQSFAQRREALAERVKAALDAGPEVTQEMGTQPSH